MEEDNANAGDTSGTGPVTLAGLDAYLTASSEEENVLSVGSDRAACDTAATSAAVNVPVSDNTAKSEISMEVSNVPELQSESGNVIDSVANVSADNLSDQVQSDSSMTSSDSSSESNESDQFGGYTVNHAATDSDDSRHSDELVHARRTRRKRLHSFLHHSSSSDHEPDASDSSDKSDVDAKTSRVDMPATSSPLPADMWKPLTEVFWRQLGGKSRKCSAPFGFERRVGGSVMLASRLTAYAKNEVHDGCVNALHFNQTGTLIASGSDDLKVVIFDWIHSKTYLSFDTGHRSNVFQAKFLPYTGDCHVVTCARDGQVRLAQLSTTGACKATKRVAAHKLSAHKLALLQDSPHVFYSCGEDAVVYQIDLRQERPNRCYTTKENDRHIALYSIHANPMNSFEHCVGGRDQYIRVYDVRKTASTDDSKGLVKKLCPHHLLTSDFKAHVTCAVYNYNGTEILGSYNDEDIYLFNNQFSEGAEHQHKYCGHRNNATVKGVNFYGPCSEFIVSGSDCGNVFVWHRDTEQIVNYFEADTGGVVNVLEPHPSIPMLATSGLDNDIKLWMPTAEGPACLRSLSKVTKKNMKEREDERNEPDVIDSQMLWFLMHTLRRNAARHAAAAAGGGSGGVFNTFGDSDQSDDSPANDDDDDDDDDAGGGDRAQCIVS